MKVLQKIYINVISVPTLACKIQIQCHICGPCTENLDDPETDFSGLSRISGKVAGVFLGIFFVLFE